MTDDSAVEGGLAEPTELEPAQGSLRLASPEDDWSVSDWEHSTAAVLRKSRRMTDEDPDDLVWQKLTRTTLDGIAVTPLGTPELLEGLQTAGRPTRVGEWDIRAHLSGVDAKAANESALVDLNGGVTSLWLSVDGDTDLRTLLNEVLLDLAPVVLDAPTAPLVAAGSLLALLKERGTKPAPGTNLGADAGADEAQLVAVARLALEAGVLGVVVDATTVHDRGASDAQELAYSLTAGARVLRSLTEAGMSAEDAAGLVEFRYAATAEQFPTIAKLRAARRLWARVLELSEVSASSTTGWTQRQHAVTSRPMMSRYDPWVNMLRTTVAAFAAGVGGADAVTVLPFDSPLGVPDAFGRRIARNTSALLISESHVATVTDPAGGSYAVEKLTDDLARAAWELFGRLEDGPGSEGALDAMVEETVARREQEIARRKRPITGVTEFPNLGETLPERPVDVTAPDVCRYGAAFEALRDAPAARPVLLAPLGTVAQHTARATFATNLLAAGGIAVTTEADASTTVACVVGADGAYDHEGAEKAAALREAGATWIIVAGQPRDWADDSAAMGVDALDFLTRTREHLQ